MYSKLRSESGVHRVQRIPKTETMGRVHTSTAVVVVLPEAEEADVEVSEVRGRERDPGASHLGLGLCAGRPLGSVQIPAAASAWVLISGQGVES